MNLILFYIYLSIEVIECKEPSLKKNSPKPPTTLKPTLQKNAIPENQTASSPMQNLQASHDLNLDHANQPNHPTPVFAHTSLNPLFHTAISFLNDTNINPMSTPFNPTKLLSSNIVVAETPQPPGEPLMLELWRRMKMLRMTAMIVTSCMRVEMKILTQQRMMYL